MKIIQDTTDFKLPWDSVVAIGKFDGIHKGHEKIIRRMNEYKKKGLRTVIFTFDQKSSVPFGKDRVLNDRVLTTKDEKRYIFDLLNIDCLIEFPFYEQTAAIPPRAFVEDILLSRLKAKAVVCGPDLSFGHKGAGNISLLREYEEDGGFQAFVVEKEQYKGEPISSSRIREEITACNIEEANRMLMLPYMFYGEVVHGKRLGRTLGMPTVNLLPKPEKLMPGSGVYYSRVRHMGLEYCSITNIGVKPTVVPRDGGTKKVPGVETYIYNFDREIYGDELLVYIYHYVRPEKDFGSLEALKSGLLEDIEAGREWHKDHL
ncbi:MAG: riboflavin biosynthesis protein RibF [Lachnospiraceae bacterium]|nr:riboflavin biosynthesis protein RibF [Lachnospiraceae bacterium]